MEWVGKELTFLPDDFKNLKNLEYLDLSENNFKESPTVIFSLEQLKILNLSFNKIYSINRDWGKLCNLTRLYLRSNHELTLFPSSFEKLKNLEYLDLTENKFDKIPLVIFSLCKLKTLDFSYNNISNISGDMKKLCNLNCLYLKNNKEITSLPSSFANLKILEYLDLSGNKFNEIPQVIFSLYNLKNLNFSYNNISRINGNWKNFRNLTGLYLSDNRIIYINKEFSEILNLNFLDISNNPVLIGKNYQKLKKQDINNIFKKLKDKGLQLLVISNTGITLKNIKMHKIEVVY